MIYFIQQGSFGPIKIGYSKDPGERHANLQTAHHARLRLLGFIEGGQSDERRLHEKFSAHRIRREWFAPSQDLVDYIRMATGANPFIDWFDEGHIDVEARSRRDDQAARRKRARAIPDIEIVPPGPGRDCWTVGSKIADIVIYEATLEDALAALINDDRLGQEFGWDDLRFPLTQDNEGSE